MSKHLWCSDIMSSRGHYWRLQAQLPSSCPRRVYCPRKAEKLLVIACHMPRIKLTPKDDAANALPAKSELLPEAEISSVSKAGNASKSRVFMLAMSSMIFTLVKSEKVEAAVVNGEQRINAWMNTICMIFSGTQKKHIQTSEIHTKRPSCLAPCLPTGMWVGAKAWQFDPAYFPHPSCPKNLGGHLVI